MTGFEVALLAVVSWGIWLLLWLLLPLWLRNRLPTVVELWGAGIVAGSGVMLYLAAVVWRAW